MELLSFSQDKQNSCKLKILFWPFTICILATTQNGNKYLHKAGERKKILYEENRFKCQDTK